MPYYGSGPNIPERPSEDVRSPESRYAWAGRAHAPTHSMLQDGEDTSTPRYQNESPVQPGAESCCGDRLWVTLGLFDRSFLGNISDRLLCWSPSTPSLGSVGCVVIEVSRNGE